MPFVRYCPTCGDRFPPETLRCPKDRSPLIEVPKDDLIGEVIDGRYKIVSQIGRGGMGVVYRAEHQMLQRAVAVKVVRREIVQDETAVKRFLTEARAIASLTNPHTVTIFDSGVTDDGTLYYAMELLEGMPLSRLLRQLVRVPYRRAVDLTAQVALSLGEAHSKGILHRDIKPDNIFVTQREGRDFAKLVDFGIAKVLDEPVDGPMTRSGMLCGTPRYLSPEQVSGQGARAETDLYALAVVLYELLTGRPLFEGDTPAQVMMMHVQDHPVSVHDKNPDVRIPPALDTFLRKALQKDPDQRYPDAGAFRTALLGAGANVSAEDETQAFPMEPLGFTEISRAETGVAETPSVEFPPGGTQDLVQGTHTQRMASALADAETLPADALPVAPTGVLDYGLDETQAAPESAPLASGKGPANWVAIAVILVAIIAAGGFLWIHWNPDCPGIEPVENLSPVSSPDVQKHLVGSSLPLDLDVHSVSEPLADTHSGGMEVVESSLEVAQEPMRDATPVAAVRTGADGSSAVTRDVPYDGSEETASQPDVAADAALFDSVDLKPRGHRPKARAHKRDSTSPSTQPKVPSGGQKEQKGENWFEGIEKLPESP